MTSDGFYRVVVPTDFSSCAEGAWALAQRLALPLGSELVLAHVLVEAPLWGEGPFNMEQVREVYASARKWADETLGRWAEQARAKGITVRTVLRTGVAPRGDRGARHATSGRIWWSSALTGAAVSTAPSSAAWPTGWCGSRPARC